MKANNSFDPKEKDEEDKTLREQIEDDGVFLVNNDGTPFDNSERTYVSVDLPEEKSGEQDETE